MKIHLLTLMESHVMFCSPQNISWTSGEAGDEFYSVTTTTMKSFHFWCDSEPTRSKRTQTDELKKMFLPPSACVWAAAPTSDETGAKAFSSAATVSFSLKEASVSIFLNQCWTSGASWDLDYTRWAVWSHLKKKKLDLVYFRCLGEAPKMFCGPLNLTSLCVDMMIKRVNNHKKWQTYPLIDRVNSWSESEHIIYRFINDFIWRWQICGQCFIMSGQQHLH